MGGGGLSVMGYPGGQKAGWSIIQLRELAGDTSQITLPKNPEDLESRAPCPERSLKVLKSLQDVLSQLQGRLRGLQWPLCLTPCLKISFTEGSGKSPCAGSCNPSPQVLKSDRLTSHVVTPAAFLIIQQSQTNTLRTEIVSSRKLRANLPQCHQRGCSASSPCHHPIPHLRPSYMHLLVLLPDDAGFDCVDGGGPRKTRTRRAITLSMPLSFPELLGTRILAVQVETNARAPPDFSKAGSILHFPSI